MLDVDKRFLREAVKQANLSVKKGGFPAGAVLVKNGKIISRGISLGSTLSDPTEHAETSCIRKACKKLKTTDLSGCTLYTSLEPCVMCFSVANWAKIDRIIFAYKKTKELIDQGYYEGDISNKTINDQNTHKIQLVYKGDFLNENINLISERESNNL